MSSKLLRIAVMLTAILFLISVLQDMRIGTLKERAEKAERNTETLLSEVKTYKVRDSLTAIKVESLELTIREFERFRSEDAALIKELQSKNRELKSINKTQSETIIKLQANGRDTIVIIDSIPVPALTFHCGDKWFDFDGLLVDKQMTGKLENRDSILIAESVRYKRFLWFKTNRIKSREVNAVSLNPHTKLLGIEHVLIER